MHRHRRARAAERRGDLPVRRSAEPGTSRPQLRVASRSRTASARSARSSTTSPRSGRAPSGEPTERERKLQDIGAKIFDELFPVDMQAYLWKHRAKVKDLIVYADEPFVPWELVHLKPPDGPASEEKPRFLAQGGLVRWQPGSFPPREMRVRTGQARSLVPDYQDPRFALTEPVHERQFLEDRFEATRVTATPTGVRTLAALRRVRPAALLRPRCRRPRRHPRRQAAAAGAASVAARSSRSTSAPPRSARTPRWAEQGDDRPARRAQRLPGRSGRRAAHHGRRLRQGVPRRRRLGVRLLPVVGAPAAVAGLRGEAVRRAARRHADQRSPPPGPARRPARPATPPGSPSSSTPGPTPSRRPPDPHHPPHQGRNPPWPATHCVSGSTSSSHCR